MLPKKMIKDFAKPMPKAPKGKPTMKGVSTSKKPKK